MKRTDDPHRNDKDSSRGVSRDMSPAAIQRRLEIAVELYGLVRVLGRAERIGAVESERERRPGHERRPPVTSGDLPPRSAP